MEVETLSPISVQAEVKKYTLVGDDIYVKRYTNDTIPDWYRNLIANLIANDATVTTINNAIAYLESLPAGFNQMITSLQNKDEVIETFLTSLAAKDGDKSAAIADLWLTKVDSTSAQAIASSTIASYFADGSASAWFNTKISTLASQTAAHASSISILAASLDDASAKIIDTQAVTVKIVDDQSVFNKEYADKFQRILLDDGAIQAGGSDGQITIYVQDTTPTNPNIYDLWRVSADIASIKEYSASSPELALLDGVSYLYRYWSGTVWIDATANQVAYIKSSLAITSAIDLADGKVRVFSVTPIAPYDTGDLWINSGEIYKSTANRESGFLASDWEVATGYTSAINSVQASVNQQIANLAFTLSNTVDVTAAQYALDMSALDGKISFEENARINAILNEQSARLAAVAAEATARGVDISSVTTAYQNYVAIVRQALVDGEITAAEQTAIDTAAAALATAKMALETSITATNGRVDTLVMAINGLDTSTLAHAASIAALDGKIDTAEQALIDQIIAEQNARLAAITAEATARGVDITAVTAAYQSYVAIVRQALVDGEITTAEQTAINTAAAALATAKTALETSILSNYDALIDLNAGDGALSAALKDGLMTFFVGTATPVNPSEYDIWERTGGDIAIGDFSARTLEIMTLNADATFYFYYVNGLWSLCTPNQIGYILEAKNLIAQADKITGIQSLADGKARIFSLTPFVPYDLDDMWISDEIRVCIAAKNKDQGYAATDWALFEPTGLKEATISIKSQASVWNTVNVGTQKYINGWQSIIEYENNHLLKNDFAVIADNFYIGAVGNIVQNGIDSVGNPVYESTGEAYKAFTVDLVNHKLKFDGVVEFSNTLNRTTSLLTNDLNWTDDTAAIAAQTTANTANATANTANTNASTALTALSDIASDALLTPSEKQLLLKEITIIIAEKALIDAQADAFSITTEKTNYGLTYSMMNIIGYLNGGTTNSLFNLFNTVPLLSNLTTTSSITMNLTVQGETLLTGAAAFRRVFSLFYTTRQTLLNAIATKAKTIADSKLSSSSDLAALVNAGTTTIDGGKITATSLLINNINALGGIIANYLQAGIASIGNTISSSDFLSIGGGGFRLKSNAAGTYADPTIYGSYIRGSYIKGCTVDADSIVSGSLTSNFFDTFSVYADNGAAAQTVVSRSFDNSAGISSLLVANITVVQTESGTLGAAITVTTTLYKDGIVVSTNRVNLSVPAGGATGATDTGSLVYGGNASNSNFTLTTVCSGGAGCTVSGSLSQTYFKK